MTTKQQILAEIERMLDDTSLYRNLDQRTGGSVALARLHSFLDTLPEEPISEYLEEAAEEYRQGEVDSGCDYIDDSDGDSLYHSACLTDAFKAGAEWMKKQMPMPEDTVLFQKGVEEGKRLMMEGAVVAHVPIDELSCGLYNLCVEAGMTSETDATIIILLKED